MSNVEKCLDVLFAREVSGGANWSVPCWNVDRISPKGFPMYITDDHDDGSSYSLIDRDWYEEREESIVNLFTSKDINQVLDFYNNLTAKKIKI